MRTAFIAYGGIAFFAIMLARHNIQNEHLDVFRDECHKPPPGKSVEEFGAWISKEFNDGATVVLDSSGCRHGYFRLVGN